MSLEECILISLSLFHNRELNSRNTFNMKPVFLCISGPSTWICIRNHRGSLLKINLWHPFYWFWISRRCCPVISSLFFQRLSKVSWSQMPFGDVHPRYAIFRVTWKNMCNCGIWLVQPIAPFFLLKGLLNVSPGLLVHSVSPPLGYPLKSVLPLVLCSPHGSWLKLCL